jgi:hypothetical protein
MRRIGAVGVAVALGALAAAFLVERGPAQTDHSSQLGEELPDLEVRAVRPARLPDESSPRS